MIVKIGFLYEEITDAAIGLYDPVEGFKVVTIVEFYKKAGDDVVVDDPLFSIESDKGIVDTHSRVKGKITKINYRAGQKWYFNGYEETSLGKLVMPHLIEIDAEGITDSTPNAEQVQQVQIEDFKEKEKIPRERKITPVAKNVAKEYGLSEEEVRKRADKNSQERITKSEVEGLIAARTQKDIRASQAARKLAREYGITLEDVIPSRKDGFVQECDVKAFLEKRDAKKEGEQKKEVELQVKTIKTYPNEEVVEPDKIRLEIAHMLSLSWQKIPHAGDTIEIDVSRLVKAKEQCGKLFQKIAGAKLRFDNFFLFFAAQNLLKPEFKFINAYWDDDDLEHELMRCVGTVNLGMAVDTEYGLVVPVIRSAEKLSFAELAKATEDIATCAKSKKLKSSEFRDLTFTVNNVGALGGEEPNMIIPYTKRDDGSRRPTCMILGIGRIKKDGLRHVAKVATKFDHRIVDAKAPLTFLNRLKEYCEEGDVESLFEI